MIETRDLTKKYGELFAVKSLSIKLDKGDVFGFIGPNGAGKTTTMRMLATLLESHLGRGVCLRLLDLHQAEGNPADDRLHARLFRRVRRHEGDRVPGILRRRVPHQRPATTQSLRRCAGTGRPGLQARRLGHQPVARHDPAARPGPRAVARSASAAASTSRPAGSTRACGSKFATSSNGWARWEKRSWSPATSCPSWPTCATKSASSRRGS